MAIRESSVNIVISNKAPSDCVAISPDSSPDTMLESIKLIAKTYEISPKIDEKRVKKLEQRAIIGGFSRHLSHNVMNALTVASGFMKHIRKESATNETLEHKWGIIESKCKLIEEIVTGYNDYTHAISLKPDEEIELFEFTSSLLKELKEKSFSKQFSAFLYNFTDQYNLDFIISDDERFNFSGSRMFLKMALCYIIKDSIRYFDEYLPLDFRVELKSNHERFDILIDVKGVSIPPAIVETMLKPWEHQALSQSFDYWGIVIAKSIIENHSGVMIISKEDSGFSINISF